MRYQYQGTTKDKQGKVIQNAVISVFLAGTSTPVSIYTTWDGATAVNNVTSDIQGKFIFFVDAFDYGSDQTYKIVISKSGFSSFTQDNIKIEDVVLGTYTISVDKTINYPVYFPKGVIISVNNGQTLTCNIIDINAGNYQVFAGAGSIIFAGGTILKSSWFPDLVTAITKISDAKVSLEITKSETINSITTNTNTILKFLNVNKIITINNGQVLTLYGELDAGLFQIFAGDGTVNFLYCNKRIVYPQWWGASISASLSINRTSIQASLNCNASQVIFTELFTVNNYITYGKDMEIKGETNGILDTNKGINFLFTATGNTDLFYPTISSAKVQYTNLFLRIDAASNLGTSNWTIILHNHKGGRFSKMKYCYFYNAKGSDNGAGNYFVIGSKYSYTASPVANIFDIWIENNIWSGFDTDLWANGDASVPAQAGLAVGWYLYSNFFSSVNTNNASSNNANLRLNNATQFSIIANSFNGNGMSGGTGFANISCQGETAHLSLFGNYWEGGPSGRIKIYMLNTTSYLNLFESSLSYNEIANSSGGLYSILSPYGSLFGGSKWSYNNNVEDLNEATLYKSVNYTLTATECGTTVTSNTNGIIFTLPPTSANMTFRIQNIGTNGTALISLSPNSVDKIMGGNIAGNDNKDRQNTKTTQKLGDFIEVVGDGVNGWYVTKVRGIWAEEV